MSTTPREPTLVRLVHPDTPTRMYLVDRLVNDGYDVTGHESHTAALLAQHKHPAPLLVVSLGVSLTTPNEEAIAVGPLLGDSAQVLALTSRPITDDSRDLLLRAGAQDVLSGPIDYPDFLARLAALADQGGVLPTGPVCHDCGHPVMKDPAGSDGVWVHERAEDSTYDAENPRFWAMPGQDPSGRSHGIVDEQDGGIVAYAVTGPLQDMLVDQLNGLEKSAAASAVDGVTQDTDHTARPHPEQ